MYLKQIIAQGFKSFADKTVIDLESGVSGIVGPNGSGKSNVVDAVRWVLGEQSVKSLRGDGNMTDVIFSGSKSRNQMNCATVTLVFDNSDKYLPLDYSEVSITRRVYRDGTNEYLINNEKCRLKDVTDILLDTGIAKESFNIISQGKVEEIISNKPLDRRTIFEEAAGVLKYKKRKEEAKRKLDRTNENMSRVNDIISELEQQVEPLKNQKEKAIKYKELSNELEKIEVALIATDITNINFKYQENKNKVDELNKEIISMNTKNSSDQAKIESYKVEINKLENEINELQTKYINQTSLVEQINSKKTVLLERKKYEVEDSKLHENLVNKKEEELKLSSDIEILKSEIKDLNTKLLSVKEHQKEEEQQLLKIASQKNNLEITLRNLIRQKENVNSKVEMLKNSIENNLNIPSGVKLVLENPKLRGIHNTISNVIEVEEKYSTCITTSLGAALNYVISDNEECSKEAIQYLKVNNLGRVTFFPLNIIKEKMIDLITLDILKHTIGFVDIASSLVKYNSIYSNIIKNQLGNVIVVDKIENANIIAKKINYKYKIVTLDGELLHVGGSITGGKIINQRNSIQDKFELENKLKEINSIQDKINEIENRINEEDNNYKNLENKIYLINKEKVDLTEIINTKNSFLIESNKKLDSIKQDIDGTKGMLDNTLEKEEEKLLEEYYKAIEEKTKYENSLENKKREKSSKTIELNDFEANSKKENSLFYQKNKELKDLEIEVNRMDVKLDTLLNKLNESYSLTYEKAHETYHLEIPESDARNKVGILRRNLKELGNVNLGAIEEFDRVNERYEFLSKQREDLEQAKMTLLEIIKEMDLVMEKEFTESFKTIKDNFKETFKQLFKGGDADLKLTDPANILETGVEIVASPPGKKLTSISLLSGGEKTFTAISLLFAILKSRPVPFCILDEVEAALDEVNVDSFGKYIISLKGKTQFILITHKKKTMEYADVLHGITMQESGVSKLVSVKLEERQ